MYSALLSAWSTLEQNWSSVLLWCSRQPSFFPILQKQIEPTKSPVAEISAWSKSETWIQNFILLILLQDNLAFIRNLPFKRRCCHFESAEGLGCKSCLWVTAIACEVLRVGSAAVSAASHRGPSVAPRRSKLSSESHRYAEAAGEGGGEGRAAGS